MLVGQILGIICFPNMVLLSRKPAARWPAIAGPANGPIICVDPGHPSEVSDGTKGGLITEMHAAWLVSLKFRALLVSAGYQVVLTKTSEKQMVTNRRRAEIGNHYKAKFMVRLHCDDGNHEGIAMYYPDRSVKLQGHFGPSKEVLKTSAAYAKVFHRVVVGALKDKLHDAGLHTDGQSYVGGKQGALTGSVFSEIPVVLVEMAVLSNPTDDKFISSEQGQMRLAKALSLGVKSLVPIKSDPTHAIASRP
jgi:N-acetylmuramoyl-L-alanine amidase